MTAIEWTDETWNPTTGCDRVSPGCDRCYAATLAPRLKAMGQPKYQRDGDPHTSAPGFGITEHPGELRAPLRWRKPRRVFVNSMSDLFHQGVSDLFLARVWAVMAATPQHTYQVLTKRHGRMRAVLSSDEFRESVYLATNLDTGEVHGDRWPLPNVWLGVSVEDQQRAHLRIPALLDTPAEVRFLSCEPLLGPIDLERPPPHDCSTLCVPRRSVCPPWYIHRLDWVIAGGESGPGARPMHPDWPRQIRDQCVDRGVPFFFKQWGGRNPKAGGRELDGRTWDDYPAATREVADA